MNVKIGDKVRVKNYKEPNDPTAYVVKGFSEGAGIPMVHVKHPTVPGIFTVPIKSIVEVLDAARISD
jgi:hypothetical protein